MSDFGDMIQGSFDEPDLKDFQTDLERAEYLLRLLNNQATNDGPSNNEHYIILRKYFLELPNYRSLLPSWIRTNRDLSQFWQFIKNKFAHYSERREFIKTDLNPLLEMTELSTEVPHEELVIEAIKEFDSDYLMHAWQKALSRKDSDPEGTITAAKALLESVFKHVLDDLKVEYGKNPEIHELYRLVSEKLNLSVNQHEEKIFKQILGGCNGIVSGMGQLRNTLGDAHGQGRKSYKASPRHAKFAINIAGSLALFILETYKQVIE